MIFRFRFLHEIYGEDDDSGIPCLCCEWDGWNLLDLFRFLLIDVALIFVLSFPPVLA